MSEPQKSIEEELQAMNKLVEALASKSGVPTQRVIELLAQRERTQINKQLTLIHEHLDSRLQIRKKKSKLK